MGKLTTHVLDTACGCPAADLRIELWWIDESSGERTRLTTTTTNSDGRTEQPLLVDDAFQPGTYELVFAIGDYFAKGSHDLPHPPFLNRVPIQFSVADATAHYHIPLLASPWAYSTYRGS
ncbi:MAG: hydroxyisourate hydrolase [Myxacorys chilensis ATA2-1-KO14]|jgi:5-hydroxyisourate hydrolase|nr:hydroxyisourate hydrolase [Myxacorys chilensis ATA2-1-KO14]